MHHRTPAGQITLGSRNKIFQGVAVMQATEAAVAQIHAEERSHCRQLLAEAKTGNAVKTGESFCLTAAVYPSWANVRI